ncbi:MAG TPA: effector-associated domain EAD1-containing protein [Polyangiaceae bacterium]|nr:effector-associated domain EAD1-containing protein [Polyangiaceae bacterium]
MSDKRESDKRDDDDSSYAPWREAAAVLATFDPSALRPAPGSPVEPRPIARLLADSTLSYNADGAPRWSLRGNVRRKVLKGIKTPAVAAELLAANPDRPKDDVVQQMLEACLRREVPPMEELSSDQVAALARVAEWLPHSMQWVPSPEALRARLEVEDLLTPLRRLADEHFHGRRDELLTLRNHIEAEAPYGAVAQIDGPVGSPLKQTPARPLLLRGLGGVGKSTLLARLILDYQAAPEATRPVFAYLDFDRPHLSVQEPLTLLVEILRQLAAQIPEQRARCENARRALTEIIELGKEAVALESLGSSDLERENEIEVIAEALGAGRPEERPLLLVLDTFEEVQFTAGAYLRELWRLLKKMQEAIPRMRVVLAGRASVEGADLLEIPLGTFDEQAATTFLQAQGVKDARIAAMVARQVGGSPMSLRLAAHLLDQSGPFGPDDLADLATRRWVSHHLREGQIQAQLYKRILGHLHNDDVRRLAHPGLVLRILTADLIAEVLAEPCGVRLPDRARPEELLRMLSEEVALITVEHAQNPDGSDLLVLRHRPDVRRVMLDLLCDDQPAKVKDIRQRAVAFHAQRATLLDRAEEIYHRLCLGEGSAEVDSRWMPGLEGFLRGAIEEVPPAQRLYLASRVGVDLDARSREAADLLVWERVVEKAVSEHLRIGREESLQEALQILSERDERSPASPLLLVEAQIMERLGRLGDAHTLASLAATRYEQASAAALALQAHIVIARVDEQDGRPSRALERLMRVARAAAAYGDLLPVRVEALLGMARLLELNGSEDEVAVAQEELGEALLRSREEDIERHPRTYSLAAATVVERRPEAAKRVASILGIRVESLRKERRTMLDNHQQSRLMDALTSAYPSLSELERFLATGLMTRLHTISNPSNVRSAIFDVVRWFSARGQLGELLKAALLDQPNNEAFIELWSETIEGAGPS